MFKTKGDTSAYWDFKLVSDRVVEKDLSDYEMVVIDFYGQPPFSSNSGKQTTEDVELKNITLTGLDNHFIDDAIVLSEVDPTITHIITGGTRFTVWPVSGYSGNVDYTITPASATVPSPKKLSGGFYQGFFKLYEYPVEFYDTAMSKGWTAEFTIFHQDVQVIPDTLNDLFPENAGFLFYIGSRAENKYNDITTVELQKMKDGYDIDFGPIRTTLYTEDEEFLLNTTGYTGYYNYVDGQYWTGREKTDDSERLNKIYNYEDVTNNALGIRITTDGRIGYRLLTETTCDDILTTGDTSNNGRVPINGYYWVDRYDACTDTYWSELVTPQYKVIEQYTQEPVMISKEGRLTNIMIVFERYFPVVNACELKFSKFRKGTLKIFVNGFKVLSAHDVEEMFPRELDTVKELQEAVPFVMSMGGGTQGLYEAVYLDHLKEVDGLLEKFFAGTYTGYLSKFNFYTIPANITMIRNRVKTVFYDYGQTITFGGRKIYTF